MKWHFPSRTNLSLEILHQVTIVLCSHLLVTSQCLVLIYPLIRHRLF